MTMRVSGRSELRRRPWAAGLAREIVPIIVVLIVGLVSGVVFPLIAGDYWIGVATTFAMWVALVESWIILSGMTGYISLGHAAFVGVGAYVMALTWGLIPFWLSMLAGGGAAGLLALLVGAPCLRVRGPYFVILTLGVSEFAKFVVINIEAGLSNFGRLMLDTPDAGVILQFMIGLAVVAFLGAFIMRRSRLGVGLRAVRENEAAAEMTGVPVTSIKILAFVLSAIIPGMAGGLTVIRSGYFEPLQVFNSLTSLTIVAMAVIGGGDDAPGPLLGVIFLVGVSELLWNSAPELYMILLGLLLIVFVLQVPDGIYGWLAPRLAPWFRKVRT